MRLGVNPDNAENLAIGFVDRDKCHRLRVVELRQFGEKLMRKFLDGFEEAKPQIFLGDVAQQFAKQRLVVRPDGTRKHAPTIPEDEMPLPLNRIRTHGHELSLQCELFACAQA